MSVDIKKIWQYITSRKFAVYLLVTIAAILVVGSLLPKVAYMQPHELQLLEKESPVRYKLATVLAPQYVVRSAPFMVIWLLLLNSTVVCTYRRIKQHVRLQASKSRGLEKTFRNPKYVDEVAADYSSVLATIKDVIPKKPFSSQVRGDDFVISEKGSQGFWGSIIFHLSLILLFLGAGISSFTRFDGGLLLTEGHSAPLAEKVVKVAQEPLLSYRLPEAIINMKSIKVKYGKSEQIVDLTADLAISNFYGVSINEAAKVNRPVYYEGYSLLPELYGITPGFDIRDEKGAVKDGFYVNLGWLPKTWTEKGTFDSFELPGKIRVKVEFIPNLRVKKGKIYSKGTIIKNPAMILTILNDATGKQIAKKLVRKNEYVSFQGNRLYFSDLKYWGYFRTVKDRGTPLITFALIAGIAGLALRFSIHEKRLWLKVAQLTNDKVEISIGGRTKYFPTLLDEEMKNLRDKILSSLVHKESV